MELSAGKVSEALLMEMLNRSGLIFMGPSALSTSGISPSLSENAMRSMMTTKMMISMLEEYRRNMSHIPVKRGGKRRIQDS